MRLEDYSIYYHKQLDKRFVIERIHNKVGGWTSVNRRYYCYVGDAKLVVEKTHSYSLEWHKQNNGRWAAYLDGKFICCAETMRDTFLDAHRDISRH